MRGFDLSIPDSVYVKTEKEAKPWIDRYLVTHKKNGGLGLDSETSSLLSHRGVVLIWSLSDGETRITVPSELLQTFREPILENPEINFDLSNAKYDAHMFANSGVDISKAGQWRDTVVQSWLVNENTPHGLKTCITDHFGRVTPAFTHIFGRVPPRRKGVPEVTQADIIRTALNDPEKFDSASDYASLDAYNSTVLRAHFDKMLAQEEMYKDYSLLDYYYQVEVPFTKLLWKLERRGITVDAGYLRSMQPAMERRMLEIEKEFNKEAGKMINLRSPLQLRWFFFEKLGKEPVEMTKGGKSGIRSPATNEAVLDQWAGEGDHWAQILLEHRKISKMYGTYVSGLQKWIDQNYRIHTTLNQAGTVTGRLSSSEPNLQNIPRANEKEDPFMIREAFIPGEGMVFVVADYAQLEMRLMAHFSGDEKMINAIKNGIDLHCLTVAEIYGYPYDLVIEAVRAEKKLKKGELGRPNLTDLEKELLLLRQAAKATGFGIIYGIQGPHLAANLTKDLGRYFSPEEGEQLIAKWFSVFPGVKRYIDSTKQVIWKQGRVQTLIARWRRFGDLKGMNRGDALQAERQGVNSIVQGSAADIAKMAMLRIENDPELKSLHAQMLLQVHDELLLECPNNPEVVKKVQIRVKEIMEHPFEEELIVPLPVEPGSGFSWASAK